MRTAAVFLALAAALVSAQDDSKKSPVEEFSITPSAVEMRDRGSWCIGERNTCEALCPGKAKENKCDIKTLDYACTCSNGTEPGLQFYDSSLYSFICQEAFKQCTSNSAGDPVELPKCKDDIQSKCGTLSISNLPDEDEGGSGNDSSGDDEGSGSDDSSSDESASDEDSEDDEGGSAALRPVWGTAAVGAAIGAMAIFL